MTLNDKFVRYRLMARHRELAKGSEFDLQVAKRILHLLNCGEIRLGLDDVSWVTEEELEASGVHVRSSRNGYTAYARIRCPEQNRP